MKKIAIPFIILGFLMTAGSIFIACWLFAAQYNSKGISHFLVITYDPYKPKQQVGELDGHDIYLEQMEINGTAFRSVKAEDVPLREAFENRLTSIDEWRKYARHKKTKGNEEILMFENYEIAVTENECVIRPISR